MNFDPSRSACSIVIGAPEEIETLVVGLRGSRIIARAPGIRLETIAVQPGRIENGLAKGADIVLTPSRFSDPQFSACAIAEDHLSCIVGPRFAGATLSMDRYLSGRHAVVGDDLGLLSRVDADERNILAQREIAARATSHFALAHIVQETELVATDSSWLLQYFASFMQLRVLEALFRKLSDTIVAQWVRQRDRDPLILWVLDQLKGSGSGGDAHGG